MATWLIEHWIGILGALTAVSGAVAGFWRLRLGGWIRNRLTAEIDLIECRRQSEHREAYLADLLNEIDSYKSLRTGSASNPISTTPQPMKSRRQS